MKYYTDLTSFDQQGGVIAIGNFDGVHRGHQALLEQTKAIATAACRPFGVLTFSPHPRRLFRPDDPPFTLTPLDLKETQLATQGADFTCSLRFDWDFASQSPHNFIKSVLDEGLKPAHIVIGEDFRFGQLRKGDPDLLRKAGYEVTEARKLTDKTAERISSSRVRQHLRKGEIEEANALLGWDWEMRGIIVEGDKRGRELGYPTANVPLGETLHPAYGVYATLVKLQNDTEEAPWRPSVTNIGIRPMFKISEGQIESHIFDFDEDIYGQVLRVRPIKRLRGEAKFDSLDELVAQMDRDSAASKSLLSELD